MPLRKPVAQLDKGPGAEHVEIGQRAAGPRRKAPAEQCPDIGVGGVGQNVFFQATGRFERLDREIPDLDVVERGLRRGLGVLATAAVSGVNA